MKGVIIVFLFISASVFSQRLIEKDLGSFDELKVFNGLYLSLEKSDVARIEITGEKSEEVVVKNVNGRLKLSMNFPKTLNADQVKMKLYYVDSLNIIDVNEGAYIRVLDTIKQNRIELKAQEGATIKAIIDSKFLVVRSVTGGEVNVKGKTESQDIDLNTGGIFKAYDLVSSKTYISASTGGTGTVFVEDILDAKVNFGGNVFYRGNPTEVTKKKIIGGTIKSEN